MSTSPGSRFRSRSRSARGGYAAAAASAAVAATHSRHSRQKQCALPQGCSTGSSNASKHMLQSRCSGTARAAGGSGRAEGAGLEVVERVLGSKPRERSIAGAGRARL
jgi:hypothetical protein